MEVYIKTFRRLSKRRIVFPKGEFTLLKGTSGIGKTTILEAITWCLFGNLREVDDPLSKQKAKVTIKTDDCEIIRSKTTCSSIEVTYKNKKYKGKEAEFIIEELYNSKDLWYISSYFPQDGRVPFLYTMTGKERLNILHKIAFTDADPRKEIEICQKEISNIKEAKEVQILKCEKSEKRYKRSKKKIDISFSCSEEELQDKKDTMDTISSSIKKLKNKKEINNNNKLRISILEENINKSNLEIQKLESKIEPVPLITNIKELIRYKKLHEKVESNKTILNSIPLYDVLFDSKYLYDNEEKEKVYNDNLSICNSFSINYDKESIISLIKDIENKIELKNLQKKIKEKIKLIDSISSYDLNLFNEDFLISTINTENSIKINKDILQEHSIKYTKESIDNEIYNIEKNLEYQDIILQVEKRNSILNDISKIPNIKLSDNIFSNDDYLETLNLEKNIKNNSSICKKLSLPYDKKEIKREIAYIDDNLSNQENIINIEKRNDILSKLETLSSVEKPEMSFTEEDLFNNIEKEKEVSISKKEYNNLNVPYTEGSVEKEISNIKELLSYQDIILQIEKRNNIIQKLEEIPELEPSEHIFTKQQLEIVTKDEEIYNKNYNICKENSVEYTRHNIEYISANYKIIKLYNKRCRYTYCTYKEYEEQKNKLKKLQDGLKCVKCPNCNTSLIHQNGKLKSSSISISTKEQVNECKEILENMEEYINLSKGIPDDFEPEDFVKGMSDKKLDLLSSLEYKDKPEFSGKYMKRQIENQEKYLKTSEERKKYKEKLSKIQEVSIPEGIEVKKLTMLEKKNYSDRLLLLSKLKYKKELEFTSQYIKQQIFNSKKYKLKEKYINKLSEYPEIELKTSFEIKKLSDKEKKEYKDRLDILNTIVFFDQPKFSSSFIKKEIENREQYNKNKELLEKYNNKLNKIPQVDIPSNIKIKKLSEKEKNDYKKKLEILNKIVYIDHPTHDSSTIKKVISVKEQLKEYENIPSELIKKTYDKNIYNDYKRVKSIIYIEKPKFSSTYIREVIKNTEERNRINKIISDDTIEMSKFTEKTDLSLEELKRIRIKIDNNTKISSLIEQEKKTIEYNQEEIKNIIIDDTIKEKLEEANTQLENIKEDIEKSENANKLLRYKEEYKKNKNNLEKINRKIELINKLRDVLISSEKEVLNNVISNINNSIKPIISKIFEDPINITFSLIKVLKNGTEKDGLGIVIKYKSVEYSSVGKLSGGEQTRVSMAFLLTIAQILNVRIILFDEPCKSLDEDIIERCTKVIRKTTKATKICIAHNELDARYDNTIVIE